MLFKNLMEKLLISYHLYYVLIIKKYFLLLLVSHIYKYIIYVIYVCIIYSILMYIILLYTCTVHVTELLNDWIDFDEVVCVYLRIEWAPGWFRFTYEPGSGTAFGFKTVPKLFSYYAETLIYIYKLIALINNQCLKDHHLRRA